MGGHASGGGGAGAGGAGGQAPAGHETEPNDGATEADYDELTLGPGMVGYSFTGSLE